MVADIVARIDALRRAIADECQSEVREESGAAYAVGFERGFAAGWEAAERAGHDRPKSAQI